MSTLLCAQTHEGSSWWNSEYNTTEGTDFWVTFMRSYGADESDEKNMKLFLYFTARETTSVTIENPNRSDLPITVTIPAKQQIKVQVPNTWGYIQLPDKPSNLGVHIVSDKPVSVYSTSHHNSGKYDGSNIIPTNALVGSYVVQTYLRDGAATEFAIVATTNQTIDINIKETILNQGKFEDIENPTLEVDTIINQSVQIYLRAGQAYLFRSSSIMGSLSGTTLCSDHPFALFQGGQCVMIPSVPENHIFHNSYPTDLYGKTFVVTPTQNAIYDYIRITAAEDNTDISRDGKYITTLQAFETFQDTLISIKDKTGYTPTTAIYKTSKPTECYLYGTSYTINGDPDPKKIAYGSPVMTPIVPQELGMHSCIFATFEDITQIKMKHYVNIVTPTSEVSGMRLDGSNIASKFKPVPSSSYSFAIIEVSDTEHYLENTNKSNNSTFTARVYGLGRSTSGAESYAYSAGSRVSRSADLLIDGAYIKEKHICKTEAVTFTPIINYDFTKYYFSYFNTDSTTSPTKSSSQTQITKFPYTFSEAGKWEVDLIVERTTPICNYYLYDTIRTNIIVHDTKYLNYGYSGGKSPNICYGEDFYIYDNKGQEYPYIADTTTLQNINGKQQKFELNKTYTFEQVHKNDWGCDSIITQKVCIRPTYEYTVYDTICQKEVPYTYIDPITGKANTGKLSRLTKSGHHVDSLKTPYGCDSIIHLHLLINPDYRISTTQTICSTQDFYWQNKHYVGEDFPTRAEGDIVVESDKTHYDSINYPTSALHHCDSIYTLALTVKDKITVPLTDTTCVHVPLSPTPNFNFSKFPDFTVDKVGTQVYVDSLTTTAGCDSIVTFTLHVLPSYDTVQIDTICQHPTETYTWEHHTGYDILDSRTNKPIRNIPRNESGWYTYIDHQYTKEGQCDSIHTLRLYVAPTYSFPENREMCDNDSIHWRGRVFVGDKAPSDFGAAIEPEYILKAGTHQDTIYHNTVINGCDSIYYLNLVIHPHHEVEDTVYYSKADIPYIDKDYPEIKVYNDTNYTKTIPNMWNCDSIVHIQVFIGETYDTLIYDTICESGIPSWEYVMEDTKGHRYECEYPLIDLGGKPVDTVYTYTLKTAAPFNSDSTVSMHLHIKPATIIDTTVIWCKSAGPYKFNHGTKEWEESGDYTDTLDIENHYGCDSILHLHLKVLPEIATSFTVNGCDNELPYNHAEHPEVAEWQGLTETGEYKHTFESKITGCDSVVTLNFVIHPYYEVEDTIYYCQSDLPYIDKDIHTIQAYKDTTYTKTLTTTIGGCDSIVHVHVDVGDTYNIHEYDTICERELPWEYVMEDTKGNRYKCEYTVTDLGGKPVDTVYTHTLTTAGPFDCDSIVSMHLHIKPTTIIDTTVIWCKSAGPYKFEHGTKEWEESGDYIDTLKIPNHYGCDSILHLHLEVLQNIITRIDTMICDNEVPFSHADPLTTKLHNLTTTGIYYDTLQTALLGCDSIIELHLTVNKTYHIYDIQHICDNEEYLFNDSLFACPAGYYEYDTLLYTAHGCDSLVTLQLHVHPTYRFEQVDSVCQDTVNTYTWVDKYGGVHTALDISKAGDFTFFDSLQTIHGCDSIYGLRLHVKPIYRFDSIYTACDDEVIYWQGKQYSGIKADPINGYDAGVYYDTVFYQTQEGCDSTYYLQYVFYPTYDTTIYVSACYDGTDGLPYYWEIHDNGTNESYVDTIDIDLFDNTESSKQFTRLLHTTHGCDSLVHLQLSVHPTYRFITDTTICSNEFVTWRGKRYRVEGIYYDSLQTEMYGCDSIYELRLHVKPAYLIELFAGKRCDDEYYVLPDEFTGLWSDTIFFRKDTINYGADELREEVYTRTFFTEEGCDSIYKIRVTVCPTYFVQEDIDTICSNEPYLWHGTTYHLQPGLHKLDTTFITINGCDSAFSTNVYVKRAYHFYQTDSICQDEEVHWQNRVIKDLPPGLHQFDTIYSTYDGCDSIYTEYVTVFPTYYNHIYDTICDNETYLWQNQVLTLTEGAYHYDTTYTTIHGCDSIWALELVVHPTTEETVYDTICAGEWYVLPNKQVNTTGYYIDTTTNEFGCNHYIHLYLEVVPPTRLTAYIDTICADDKAFEITYHYQGTYPIEYSVYFTNEGLSQGFEDIIHAPIVDLTDSTISIEIPRGEELPKPNERYYDGVTHQFTTNPKYQYVQPDIYTIKVYLHNGICSDDTLAYDYVDALIQYPHWIHEQHWNDAIVIYKDTFNGGYEFTHYQWYENGKPLEGEIGEYLYLPHNLQRDAYYQVALTRKSDGKTFMTCPITPAFDVDSIVPRLPYFSVVPTLVYTSHPYVSILCSIGGYYEIYHPTGTIIQERKRFEPEYDASILQQNPGLPANVMKDDIYLGVGEGLYIIKLTADNGEERTIKIVVTNETIY